MSDGASSVTEPCSVDLDGNQLSQMGSPQPAMPGPPAHPAPHDDSNNDTISEGRNTPKAPVMTAAQISDKKAVEWLNKRLEQPASSPFRFRTPTPEPECFELPLDILLKNATPKMANYYKQRAACLRMEQDFAYIDNPDASFEVIPDSTDSDVPEVAREVEEAIGSVTIDNGDVRLRG
ncbi:hypothetical protein DFP72DRAFT_1058447 [Ephemerocybe angulata]|uniref:Uncharacterized protein n=1 Tax=Ephemerocybe angulata TaxID=980116 RepID=A0A8H6MFT9_9AGAR|nr:hypothetical protein DFP72DRAFT_1058447 [Tulosesus angulatus]